MRSLNKNNVKALAAPLVRPLAIVGAVVGVGALLRWQLQRLFTEKPSYVVEEHRGPLEIRTLPASLVARTVVYADFDHARAEGFTRLARFIFGENHHHTRAQAAALGGHADKIAMTAPVTLEHSGKGVVVSFHMPRDRPLSTLPYPDDPRVELVQLPERRVAALSWSGGTSAARIASMEDRLLEEVKQRGMLAAGAPVFAGFDPPSTLPPLRHNEVYVELREP